MPLLPASLVTLALLLAGVPGGTAAAAAAARSTSSAPPVGAAAAQDGDRRLARRILIRRADLPRGWRASPGGSPAGEGDSPCAALERASAATTGEAAAAFTRRTALVASVALVYRGKREARRQFAALTARRTQRCFARELTEAAASGAREGDDEVEVGRFRLRRLTPPQVGDQRSLVRIRIPFTVRGMPLNFYFDVAHLRVGRAVALVLAGEGLAPFDPALRDELLATVDEQMTKALAS